MRTVVKADGLGALRRDLGRIDKGLKKSADAHIRKTAAKVRADARTKAPRKTGKLAGSIRYGLRSRGASIYSNLEYAPVLEYGGVIAPRGTRITIEPRSFLRDAVDENTEFIDEQMGDLLDHIANAHGF